MGLYAYCMIPASPYPEVVTKHIRKALYFEGAGNDPRQAVQCYLQALEEATIQGLDQTGDDMTGLKIKIGAVYESSGRLDSALRVYGGLLGEIKGALNSKNLSLEDRTRLLRRAIGTSIKVGDLSLSVPSAHTKAETAYTWALEAFLKESASRDGDTSWLEVDAIGGLYEAVANFYYADGRSHLALPLYLKSLEAVNEANCHTITIMNNIASAISSQSNVPQIQENAAQWGLRARDLKVSWKTAEEKAECDLGRCSACFNLGMISEKRQRIEEAQGHYKNALRKAIALQSEDGQGIEVMAIAGLERVQSRTN
ncbi:protein of unknown function [Taphrina deformans PYCC 5710]|uniref:TPR domain protein n=1 Tax=Taphrina deformans (strain PYCC 5710 / ATCC 11124 / CBS 356.35 / IMI 108563 / JCM 9778 / NBRC 8474) TaxID=1097556 RepID=R4XM40_TAPDE|nr:protein of unknown function [Taphrina deformans PYCC 5710]|eukprot:CCG84365.1 protein of unknown function [Taphrina deformans PYCC 5710]